MRNNQAGGQAVSRWPNKYVIGLTGNIAVGKSVVRQMLQHLGAYPIDADGLSHQALAPGAPAYAPVVDMFGRFVLDSEGRIDRRKLGAIAFTMPEALETLERLTHPVVFQAINTLILRAKQRVVVVEAIKLLETDLMNAVDVVWVVDASPETQLKRLVEKRGLSHEDALRRVTAQRAQREKVKRAHFVITNDGNVDETWRQVQAGWAKVQRSIGGEKPPADEQPAMSVGKRATSTSEMRAAETSSARPASGQDQALLIRRGMPGNAELIAQFIGRVSGKKIDRMDIMLAFGQKSYLLATDRNGRVVAIVGWQVENLITRADEFYIEPSIPRDVVIEALVKAIEEASRELQSEVGFILLPVATPQETIQAFLRSGYEATTLDDIRVPAWREAVHEAVSENPRILTKRLRADRIMRPI